MMQLVCTSKELLLDHDAFGTVSHCADVVEGTVYGEEGGDFVTNLEDTSDGLMTNDDFGVDGVGHDCSDEL